MRTEASHLCFQRNHLLEILLRSGIWEYDCRRQSPSQDSEAGKSTPFHSFTISAHVRPWVLISSSSAILGVLIRTQWRLIHMRHTKGCQSKDFSSSNAKVCPRERNWGDFWEPKSRVTSWLGLEFLGQASQWTWALYLNIHFASSQLAGNTESELREVWRKAYVYLCSWRVHP